MALNVILLFLCGLIVCNAAPRTTIESNDIPQVYVGSEGVSASIGGYQASAGLGGTLDGGPAGGLYAQAGTPGGTGAAAGLGGSVANGGVLYSGAGVGNGDSTPSQSSPGKGHRGPRPRARQRPGPGQRSPEFYDNIFNIPISVLQAVNQLLGGGAGGGAGGVGGAKSGGSAVANSRSDVTTKSASWSKSGAIAPAAAPKTFFDDIFNIPISALRSVNQLLNNKNQPQGQADQRKVPL